MRGLMMDYPLTLSMILRRAEAFYPQREIVSRVADDQWHRYGYGEMAHRARQLALAMQRLGIAAGERVATLCGNHHRHLEAYFGIPISGAVLHTLNPRLCSDELAYIINEADDRALIVDSSLLPLFEAIRSRVQVAHVIVADEEAVDEDMLGFETLLAAEDADGFVEAPLDEQQAAMMCHTSGTVGRPKGVVYSHRALTIHTLAGALNCGFEVWESDCLLPAVPMYHVNGWGLPYIAAMMGAKLVFSGKWLDPASLLEAFEREQVTFSAGVPTIWIDILKTLEAGERQYDLTKLRKVIIGGAALPQSLMATFRDRYGVRLVPAWGMTETTPMGATAYLRHDQLADSAEHQDDHLCRQGIPVPILEIRGRGPAGLVPWDGQQMGELEVRGPCVAGSYYQRPDAADQFTDDGWFRTGDIVSINSVGSIKIEDREKDLIKSGGEWISSVDLEAAIMAHPAILEAAVVAIPHEKWGERPLAVVVSKEGKQVSAEELTEHLRARVAKWWLPDRYEFVREIPRTSVGKFKKNILRERFA